MAGLELQRTTNLCSLVAYGGAICCSGQRLRLPVSALWRGPCLYGTAPPWGVQVAHFAIWQNTRMPTQQSQQPSFWRGVLQTAVGGLIVAVAVAIGSLLLGYARARQMSVPFNTAIYISAYVVGSCLVIWGLYSGMVWINRFLLPARRGLDAASAVKAGALYTRAGEAEALLEFLEKIWHLYDQDRTHGEPALIYPLSEKFVPDPSKWKTMQLLEFRILYRWHINSLKSIEPTFHSKVIDDGFPSDVQYIDVTRNLQKHADLLRESADSLLHPSSDAKGA
jgi:hypothetical protein